MPQSQAHHTRDLSVLEGTCKTLARAVSGLQMSADRLVQLLTEEAARHDNPPGLATVIQSLKSLSPEDHAIVDAILSGRERHKRKVK